MKEYNPPRPLKNTRYVHWLSHKIYVAEKMTYSTGGQATSIASPFTYNFLPINFSPIVFDVVQFTILVLEQVEI